MKTRMALFVHQPRCSVQSVNGIMNALNEEYTFKIFTKHEIEDDFFNDVDVICFPGGIGDSDAHDFLFKQNGESIQRFIDNGGKYLGICMGAYWADNDYFNLLDDVRVVQYIKQPNTDTHRPHAKAMPVVWEDVSLKMYFYDGATFTGNNFDTVATYPNGDPMAIIQDNIGLIGCHPESTKHWYESYSWMKKQWHNDTHGELLLNFTNKLMGKE